PSALRRKPRNRQTRQPCRRCPGASAAAAAMRPPHLSVHTCIFERKAHIDAALGNSRCAGSPGLMLFWILVIVVTALACAALYYAARGRTVNATGDAATDLTTDHFRQQLREIGIDTAAGRLGAAEAAAARAELARELLRTKRAGGGTTAAASRSVGAALPLSLLAVAALA